MNQLPDAIILCGGAGRRLKSVTGHVPKPLASIGGHPFIELLLQQLGENGFRRVILAVGYNKELIRYTVGDRAYGVEVVYSEESSPLGTGGALRKAAELLTTDAALVMNGDSYLYLDLRRFVISHRERSGEVSIVVVPADSRTDSGTVTIDDCGLLVGFDEKTPNVAARYMNAGIYLISGRIISDIPLGIESSLEREVFPRWLKIGLPIRTFLGAGPCIDIGTPERYKKAQSLLFNSVRKLGPAR